MTTKVTKVTSSKAKQKIIVGFVLDESGSMSSFRQDAMNAFDAIGNQIKKEANFTGIETDVSLYTFNTRTNKRFQTVSSNDLQPMNTYGYIPNNGTALLDAVYDMIQDFKKLDKPETSFLIYALTDGEENSSRRCTASTMNGEIKQLQDTGKWTFGFHMPPGFASYAQKLGIDRDNIREWEVSKKGIQETVLASAAANASYFSQRKTKGATARISNLFTTDLSGLSAKTLHMKLDDISNHFKEFEVPAEQRVDEFTEKKTKKPYVIGQTFYQLMKVEKIQPTKQILIQEKGKKAIWGGDQARELIGLPKAVSGQEVKVKPGNHANYDVYVQSTSPNRKLPRGTKILVDVTMTKGLTPTWDYTALATTI